MKLVAVCLSIVFIFSSCGVETNSSVTNSKDSTIVGELPENNTSDINSSDGTDIPDSDINNPNNTIGSSSNFDMKDATFDEKACSISYGYNVRFDSSFDPNSTSDDDNGIEIESRYAYNTDVEATKIHIFYPNLTQNLLENMVNVYSDNYRFGFNEAWIANDNKIIYVRLAKNGAGHYGCHRYELNSLTGSVESTKVYR